MKRKLNISTTTLAKICGVSQGTVDRALHDREGISPKTKQKILSALKEYEYLPRADGKAAKGKSMLIGVVLFDLYNDFFSKLAMSITNRAKTDGYAVIFSFSNKNLNEERQALDYFDRIGADGIILFSAGSDDENYANYLNSLNVPLVTIGNRLFDLPYIGVDNFSAMHDVTIEMLKQTSGKLQYFAPALEKALSENNAQRQRAAGFIAAAESHRRPYKIITNENELSFKEAGIICSTDYYLLKALKKSGFKRDIKIAGFDYIPMLSYVDSKIFTVDYSTDEVADECMNYFLKRKYKSAIPYRIRYNR